MEYNFINWAFFVGLIGGGIPWGTLFFYNKVPAENYALLFQFICLVIGGGNLFYGLYIIFFN